MRTTTRVAATSAVALALAGAATQAAPAHQTAVDRGVSVTLHVAPDDEPVAGRAATISVTRVRVPSGGRFRFGSCRCRVKVADASGRVLLDRAMEKRRSFTFPAPAAYRITYSGTYRRNGATRRFSTGFALRANAS